MYIKICLGKEEVEKVGEMLNSAKENLGIETLCTMSNHHEIVNKGAYLVDTKTDEEGTLTLDIGIDMSYIKFVLTSFKDIIDIVKPITGALTVVLKSMKTRFSKVFRAKLVHKVNGIEVVDKEDK